MSFLSLATFETMRTLYQPSAWSLFYQILQNIGKSPHHWPVLPRMEMVLTAELYETLNTYKVQHIRRRC